MSTIGSLLAFVIFGRPLRAYRRNHPRGGPVRDLRYRAFIRKHACCACGSRKLIDCAHTGPHGLGQKAPDAQCIPLCGWCHTGSNESLHHIGPVAFQEFWGIRFDRIIRNLQCEYANGRSEPQLRNL